MSAILYINDNNLLLQQGGSVERAQGYAWLRETGVEFDGALETCRLEPQQINNRYWQQCDQSSIASNGASMRHAADLVWGHLSELKQQHDLQQVALIVPSHYQTANLQLLLGICKSCQIEVSQLMNKAVLALQSKVSDNGTYVHVDLQLHQTVCSQLEVSDGNIKLSNVDVLHEISIQGIQDSLLRAMQECFIRADRFDPLHYAETEQQLFNQIPLAAAEIAEHGKANLLVEYQGKLHTVSIDIKQWNKALQPSIDKITKAGRANSAAHAYLQFNNIFSGSAFAPFDAASFTVLEDSAVAEPSHVSAAKTQSGELIYITELPIIVSASAKLTSAAASAKAAAGQTQASAVPTTPNKASPTPLSNGDASTHLLQAGVAVPLAKAHIDTSGTQLGLQQAEVSNAQILLDTGQIFVMSDPQRKYLQADDRIGSEMVDGVITVIRVLE